jgi:hypothetical protein
VQLCTQRLALPVQRRFQFYPDEGTSFRYTAHPELSVHRKMQDQQQS